MYNTGLGQPISPDVLYIGVNYIVHNTGARYHVILLLDVYAGF